MKLLIPKTFILILALLASFVPFSPDASADHFRHLVVKVTPVLQDADCPATFQDAYDLGSDISVERGETVSLCVNAMNGSEEWHAFSPTLTISGDGILFRVFPYDWVGGDRLTTSGGQASYRTDVQVGHDDLQVNVLLTAVVNGQQQRWSGTAWIEAEVPQITTTYVPQRPFLERNAMPTFSLPWYVPLPWWAADSN